MGWKQREGSDPSTAPPIIPDWSITRIHGCSFSDELGFQELS
jgi:hypothetical protein